MTSKSTAGFQIATWYDTWNQTGLDNLVNKIVPLNYATRYNLAFGQLSPLTSGGYSIEMTGQYADDVKQEIQAQASGVVFYAGLGNTGIIETVADNALYENRSTHNMVAWLQGNGYSGISLDVEEYPSPGPAAVMVAVAELVQQLGPIFKAAGLGIAVSVPWPGLGPAALYGDGAVQAFNANVNVLEMQDYSSYNTQNSAEIWTSAGVPANLLMGGVCTENSDVQTSLQDTQSWTEYAMQNGLQGMFSWRLDNDHGTQGTEEDVDPTFTGAQTIYNTAIGVSAT